MQTWHLPSITMVLPFSLRSSLNDWRLSVFLRCKAEAGLIASGATAPMRKVQAQREEQPAVMVLEDDSLPANPPRRLARVSKDIVHA